MEPLIEQNLLVIERRINYIMFVLQVYGCSLPPGLSSSQPSTGNEEEEDIFAVGLLFAPKDVEVFTFTPKDDKHGLGYKGLDPSTALFGQDNWLGVEPMSTRVGRKGISGEVHYTCSTLCPFFKPPLFMSSISIAHTLAHQPKDGMGRNGTFS